MTTLKDKMFTDFALCREMLDVPAIIAGFDFSITAAEAAVVKQVGRLFLTGEGSSRIFPAKSFIDSLRSYGSVIDIATEGSLQAVDYQLGNSVVFGASNSGQTKELVILFNKLAEQKHPHFYGVTANTNTKIESLAKKTFVLNCGKEQAVAATKSVVEQALVYRSMLDILCNAQLNYQKNQAAAAKTAEQVLTQPIEKKLIDKLSAAPVIYFAGRNDGVAEELTLKTSEIVRRKSMYLEGTYLLHGVEEIMNPDEVVVLINPFKSELETIKKNLVEKIGMTVIAIAPSDAKIGEYFPTLEYEHCNGYDTFHQLMAGWNLLAHTGVALGIDLDKPKRARKIGNVCE